MRNYLYAFMAIVAVVMMTSCEQEYITYEGPNYIRFTDTTVTYKESFGKVIPIQVHLVGEPQSQDIEVQYALSGSAIEGRDYSIEGKKGTVIIPANSFKGVINVNLINNSNNILRSQDLVFTLLSASASSEVQVGTGKYKSMGASMRLVIQDDCLFGGFYSGMRAQSNAKVLDVEVYSQNCEDYYLSNWNIDILSFKAERLSLQFKDNGDNSITIPKQLNVSIGDSLYGNGAWDPRSKRIVLNVKIRQEDEQGVVSELAIPQLTFTPR